MIGVIMTSLNGKYRCDYEDYPRAALSAPAPKQISFPVKTRKRTSCIMKTGTSRYSRTDRLNYDVT